MTFSGRPFFYVGMGEILQYDYIMQFVHYLH